MCLPSSTTARCFIRLLWVKDITQNSRSSFSKDWPNDDSMLRESSWYDYYDLRVMDRRDGWIVLYSYSNVAYILWIVGTAGPFYTVTWMMLTWSWSETHWNDQKLQYTNGVAISVILVRGSSPLWSFLTWKAEIQYVVWCGLNIVPQKFPTKLCHLKIRLN